MYEKFTQLFFKFSNTSSKITPISLNFSQNFVKISIANSKNLRNSSKFRRNIFLNDINFIFRNFCIFYLKTLHMVQKIHIVSLRNFSDIFFFFYFPNFVKIKFYQNILKIFMLISLKFYRYHKKFTLFSHKFLSIS